MNELAQKRSQGKSASPSGGTDWPPSWRTQPHGISVGRYIDPAFTALEFDRLWSRVWQAAARLDEIPERGDFTVYEIGDQAALVVRVDESTVKVYHNFCPHRGTALGDGQGKFDKNLIICPFHGWRWNLEGENEFILEQQEFKEGKLRNSDVPLRELHSVVFGGFVFITFAQDPQPFDEFIEPVRQIIEDLATADMRHYWWKAIPVESNWKTAQEAFYEAFHVPATHPQLEQNAAEVIRGEREEAEFTHRYVAYTPHEHGHGRYFGLKKPMSGDVADKKGDPLEDMAGRLQLLVDGMDAMVLQEDVDTLRTLRDKPIPEGSTLGSEYVKALYNSAAEQDRPMPKADPDVLAMWGGMVVIFPNLMILPQGGNQMIYRVRPHATDPDRCIFEIMSTKSYPASVEPPRATMETVTDINDPEQVRLIPRQDLGNIPRVQKGMHSRAMHQNWLAEEQEKLILNMHRELDRYLQSGD